MKAPTKCPLLLLHAYIERVIAHLQREQDQKTTQLFHWVSTCSSQKSHDCSGDPHVFRKSPDAPFFITSLRRRHLPDICPHEKCPPVAWSKGCWSNALTRAARSGSDTTWENAPRSKAQAVLRPLQDPSVINTHPGVVCQHFHKKWCWYIKFTRSCRVLRACASASVAPLNGIEQQHSL